MILPKTPSPPPFLQMLSSLKNSTLLLRDETRNQLTFSPVVYLPYFFAFILGRTLSMRSTVLIIFPVSGSFSVNQFLALGGQSIGASASVLPMDIQDWFPLGLTGLIFLQSKGLSRVVFNSIVQKHQFFSAKLSLWSNSPHLWSKSSIHDYWKNRSFD